MGIKGAKRILASLMCISLVFQSSTVTSLATELSVQEQKPEDTEILQETETSEDNVSSIQENEIETLSSETGSKDSTEEDFTSQEPSETMPESAITDESQTTEKYETEERETEDTTETDTTEERETEQSTPEESTAETSPIEESTTETSSIEESTTETSQTDDEDESIIPGEFQDVSVEFDGCYAVLNARYILSSNANAAEFRLVSYNQDGEEITGYQWSQSKEEENLYNISEEKVALYNEARSVEIKAIERDESGVLISEICTNAYVREKIPEIHFTASEPEVEAGRISVPYYFDGNLNCLDGKDGEGVYFNATLKCKTDNDDEDPYVTYGQWLSGDSDEEFFITVDGLEAATVYQVELYIEIMGPDPDLGNIYEQIIYLPDCTTPKDDSYDLEKEFPDQVFREIIREMLFIEKEETIVKESQLLRINFLDASREDSTAPAIKNIKGIELLCNAEYISITGHEITDISDIAWEKLQKMQSLNLQGNCIERLPDLTKCTELKYFDIPDNYLPPEEILNRQDKLPEGCECWSYGQRHKEFNLIMEEKYYQVNGKSEVALRLQGYNNCFSPTFKTYIDGNPIKLAVDYYSDEDGYNYLIMYSRDIPYEIGKHSLKVEMYEGESEKFVVSKEAEFEIAEDRAYIVGDNSWQKTDAYYMSAQQEYLNIRTYSAKEVSEVYLLRNDIIYGRNDYLNCDNEEIRYVYRYPNLGNYSSECYYYNTYADLRMNKNQMPTGVYDLKLVYKDGTQEILEGTVEVISNAIIKSCSAGGSYDSTNEYLYLALTADNLDPSRINYIIKADSTNDVLKTEYVDCKPIYDGYVVKLKKLNWDSSITSISVNFSGKEDYPLYVTSSNMYCYIENIMYFSNYNYKSNMLEVGMTSHLNLSDYTYSIVRSDSWDFSTEHIQEEYTVRLDEVEETIYNAVPQWEGEDCTLYGGYYQFAIQRLDDSYPIKTYDFYIPGLVVERSKRLTDNGYWENDAYRHLVQKNIGSISYHYYSEVEYVEGNAEDFFAQITGDTLESPLDVQSLWTWNHSSDTYKTGIGMDFDFSVLEVGDYTIELYYRNSLLTSYDIQVIPNDIFVMYDYLYATWNSEDRFYVSFYTPNCGEDDDFTILLTDINGEEVEGLTISDVYKGTSYINFYVSGLEKSEADRYYYIKILHKTKGEAYCEDLKTKYYKGYGQYIRLNIDTRYWWNNLYIDGREQGCTGLWQNDSTLFPAVLTVYKFNSTDSLYSIVLNEEDFDGSNYYFTQDLIDVLPRTDGYYDIVLTGNAGQFLMNQATHISLDSDVLNEFSVTPMSMTLKLDIEEESSKAITVLNSTQTPTFESDDTSVATVTVSEDDSNVAIVKAVGVGETSITVISGSHIKKVTVVVTETPVEANNIKFNEEEISTSRGMTIVATVTVEPEKAWLSSSKISYTSSDENIVSVGESTTRNITLTAKNPGTATIMANLEGTDLTAECIVTVSAGLTEEEEAELISSVGTLHFLQGAESTLADISLPEGWRWSNPSQKPTSDSDRPEKTFSAIYAKDGLDCFSAELPVFVTSVNAKITGTADLELSAAGKYKIEYEYIGYIPVDDSVYTASFQWMENDHLLIQGKADEAEVSIQAGTVAGRYVLQGVLAIKNVQSGKEFRDTLNYSVRIKDDTDAKNEVIKNTMYYFLEGADTKLGDINIGDGWSWSRPETVPQADISGRVQSFEAQYVTEGEEPVKADLTVAVSKLDKVDISGESKVAAEKIGNYALHYSFSGYDIRDVQGYDISYKWTGSEGLTIQGADYEDTASVKMGSKSGSSVVKAVVTVKNKQTGKEAKVEGSFQVQVLDAGSVDHIDIKVAERQPEKALACVVSKGVIESDYTVFDQKNNYQIQLVADTMSGDISEKVSIQWASSDKKVADINANGLITVKGAGVTVISATAMDSGQYSEEVVLKVQDFTPVLDEKSITVYQYSSKGTEMGLTAQNGNKIQSVSVNVAGLTAQEEAGIWYLTAKNYTRKTSENAVLTIITDKGKYEKSLKVNVDVSQPKATVKQSVKPNIFYVDTKAVYKVTSKYLIERIEDASPASKTCFHVKAYDAKGGILTLEPYGIAENIESYKVKNSDALKAQIKVFFEGYKDPVEMEVKVNVQNKRPSLRVNTTSIIKNVGMNEALTTVLNGKSIYDLSSASVRSKTDNVGLSIVDGKLRLNYHGTSNITYKADIKDRNWTQAIAVSGKIQMVNADALELEAQYSKVTVNKAKLSTVIIPVAVKGNSALEPNIRIDCDPSALKVSYQNGSIKIDVLENAPDGTYKVIVGGTLEVAGRTIDVKKTTIKIFVTSKDASVKLFASGKINVADREYSSVTYIPTLKNMDAKLIGAEVTGEMSEYFYAYVDEAGKVVLKAISGKEIKANTKYSIDITTYFDNDFRTTTKVNIKPVNKLPKVKVSSTKGTLYKAGVNSRVSVKLTFDTKYRIGQVRLVESTDSKYFTLTQDESGLVIFALSDNGLKIPSGTYTMSYQILIADADSDKPITQKIKITVK